MVTLKEQEEAPHTFDALHVTVVVPVEKTDPDAGTQLTGAAGIPLAEGSLHEATWLSHCTMFPGHAPMTGDSFTVTENEHVDTAQLFVALQLTVVVPAANVDPEAGLQTMTGDGEPVAEGSLQVAV